MKKTTFFSTQRIVVLVFMNCLWIVFYSLFSFFLVKELSFHWCFVIFIGWIIWYTWHTLFFTTLANIIHWIRLRNSYALLIFCQVSPGVSFFSTMMLMPLIYGISEGVRVGDNTPLLSLGVILIAIGCALIIQSFRIIGIGGAAFENDYSARKPDLIKSSIYGYIRHPLYTGALLASFGLSFVFFSEISLFIPLISLLFTPVYKLIEENRLIDIYGSKYLKYCEEVPAFFPVNYVWRTIRRVVEK